MLTLVFAWFRGSVALKLCIAITGCYLAIRGDLWCELRSFNQVTQPPSKRKNAGSTQWKAVDPILRCGLSGALGVGS